DEDHSVEPVRPAGARIEQLRERDRVAVFVGQSEVGRLLTDLRRSGRRRDLSQKIKNIETEETQKANPQDEEDRAGDLATIELRLAIGAPHPTSDQEQTGAEYQQRGPREIPGRGKPRSEERRVGKEGKTTKRTTD